MAEEQRTRTTVAERSPTEPLLRQGRPADPAPAQSAQAAGNQAEAGAVANVAGKPAPTTDDNKPSTSSDQPEAGSGDEAVVGIEKTLAESRQRKLRLMLRQCDRVMLMDFDILAMSDWPDNYRLATARRSRDLWLFSCFLSFIVFLSGMTGFVPAWIAGGGFGVFVILLLLGLPAVRALYTSKPSYLDLIVRRRRMLRDARKHIEHLEGKDGLIWQCARMAEFNVALRATRFTELLALSERRVLARHLNRREHVRLYLVYLLEAEKAYNRTQQAFFEGHQEAIDRGWETVAHSNERET